MPEQDNNEGFLLRWSRRKRGAEEPARTKTSAVEVPADPVARETTVASLDHQHEIISNEASTEVSPSAQDGEPTTVEATENDVAPHDLENIDIDAMDYESDYTDFMKDGVPEALKRKALRQLWRSDPILANVDGLCDYDDDFTDAALAVDVLKTVHKVGKGYLTDDEDEAEDTDDIDELEDADEGNASAAANADEPVEAAGDEASVESDARPEGADFAETTGIDETEPMDFDDEDEPHPVERS